MQLNIPEVDLIALIEADLRHRVQKGARSWWRCPFHDDRNPSLTVTPDGQRWKCFACAAQGDAIDWVRRREGVDFKGAIAMLEGELKTERPPRRTSPLQKPMKAATPDFHAKAMAIVEQSERRLWSADGTKAMTWLKARGLTEATIRAARLGYIPQNGEIDGVYVDRGISIPWFAGSQVCFVQVRRPKDEPKYRAIKGGCRSACYPATPTPGRPVLICEGEFDALLARQELNNVADAVTLGGATEEIDAEVATTIASCPVVLVATDNDTSGESAAAKWAKATSRAHRVRPPQGKDITDAYLAGTDLAAWIKAQLAPSPVKELVPVVAPNDELDVVNLDQQTIDPPAPCPCGSLMLWWDLSGTVHCSNCDPPNSSRRLMEARAHILATNRH